MQVSCPYRLTCQALLLPMAHVRPGCQVADSVGPSRMPTWGFHCCRVHMCCTSMVGSLTASVLDGLRALSALGNLFCAGKSRADWCTESSVSSVLGPPSLQVYNQFEACFGAASVFEGPLHAGSPCQVRSVHPCARCHDRSPYAAGRAAAERLKIQPPPVQAIWQSACAPKLPSCPSASLLPSAPVRASPRGTWSTSPAACMGRSGWTASAPFRWAPHLSGRPWLSAVFC